MKRTFASLLLLATLLLLSLPVPASAYSPPSPVQNLLFRAKDPADLRAQLRAHRDSVAEGDVLDAAEAWYWLGVSHSRSSQLDSAITAFRRCCAIRGNDEDVWALNDLLLQRARRDDGVEAARLMEPVRLALEGDRGPRGAAVRLRAAWALAVAGDVAGACSGVLARRTDLLAPREKPPSWSLWASRFAPALFAGGHSADGWSLLAPLLAASRGRDSALVALARSARADRPFAGESDAFIANVAARADSQLAASVPGTTLRRIVVRADDGARLTAWALPAAPRSPLVILVLAPEATSFADADSLVAQLHRTGMSVALLDPRGSRGSTTSAFALPLVWAGHEDALQRRLARDIVAAIAPSVQATGADPARVCVATEGPLVVAAALAAAADTRVRALLLAGATPSGAERGWLRETLAAASVPVFFLQGPEDVYGNEVMDRIASLLSPRLVRVADSQSGGRGVALFRAGPASAKRLTDWLGYQWTSRPATRPARRR